MLANDTSCTVKTHRTRRAVYGTNPIRVGSEGAGPTHVLVGVIKGVDGAAVGAILDNPVKINVCAIGHTIHASQWIVVNVQPIQRRVVLESVRIDTDEGIIVQIQIPQLCVVLESVRMDTDEGIVVQIEIPQVRVVLESVRGDIRKSVVGQIERI